MRLTHLALVPPLLLIACAPDAEAPTEASPAEARATPMSSPRPIVHRGEDTPPPLSIVWSDGPTVARARTGLGLTITSHAPAAISARVELSVLGADDRERIESLGSVTVPAGGSRTLAVDLSRLRFQSTTHSAQLVAVARFAHADDTLAVQSDVIAYHFEAGFVRAQVYSLDEMVQSQGGGLVQRGRAPEARTVEGGVTRTITTELAASPMIAFVPTFSASAQRDLGLMEVAETPGLAAIDPLYCQKNPWNCCTGSNCVDVCADWRTSYVDAGTNYEDYGKAVSGSAYQTVDASYAHFTLEECSGSSCASGATQIKDAYFGPDGCALVDLDVGALHRLSVYTQHRRQGVDVTTNYYSSNSLSSFVGVTQLNKTFYAADKDVEPVEALTLNYHASANAAAAVSRALTISKPGDDVTVKAGLGCNDGAASGGIPATDACAGGDFLWTGPTQKPDGTPGRLRWKFVIAHELGHVYQATFDAMPSSGGYCFSSGYGWEPGCSGYVDPSQAASPLCRCDHVTGSNKLHCLQSLERDSAAQIEGFGQFFAARTWNDPNGTDCDFSYYKQFNAFLLFGTAVVQPPVHIDCKEQVRWRDTFCFAQGMSTEYDWLNFLWNVNTVGSGTSSLTDLFEIWKLANAAGGSSVSWSHLASAAATHHGSGSAKHNKFLADGDEFGVDGNQF